MHFLIGTNTFSPNIISVIQCSNPTQITHAAMSLTGNDIGNTVTYTCVSGYNQSSGDLTLACNDNGQWSGTFPVCEGTCIADDLFSNIKCITQL